MPLSGGDLRQAPLEHADHAVPVGVSFLIGQHRLECRGVEGAHPATQRREGQVVVAGQRRGAACGPGRSGRSSPGLRGCPGAGELLFRRRGSRVSGGWCVSGSGDRRGGVSISGRSRSSRGAQRQQGAGGGRLVAVENQGTAVAAEARVRARRCRGCAGLVVGVAAFPTARGTVPLRVSSGDVAATAFVEDARGRPFGAVRSGDVARFGSPERTACSGRQQQLKPTPRRKPPRHYRRGLLAVGR